MPAFSPGSARCDPVEASPPGVVLVVDDNDCVAGLMARILERRGRSVLRAAAGAECERLFEEHEKQIALAIVDCRLPDTDGLSLCRRLRARAPTLRILLTSGQNYGGPRSMSGGAVAFLAKPFLPAQLEQTIDRLCGILRSTVAGA
jgi:CheY-like chemotaxis protein